MPTDPTDSYNVTAEADAAHDDKWLADQCVERYWSKVDWAMDDNSRCWNWKAGKFTKGYGGFWTQGRWQKAHRIMWSLIYGPIPEGMFICHHCDNPACCKPAHLFIGTNADNQRDKANKGRAHVCSLEHYRHIQRLSVQKRKDNGNY